MKSSIFDPHAGFSISMEIGLHHEPICKDEKEKVEYMPYLTSISHEQAIQDQLLTAGKTATRLPNSCISIQAEWSIVKLSTAER